MNKKIYYVILVILLALSVYQVWNFSFDYYWWSVSGLVCLVIWVWARKDIMAQLACFNQDKTRINLPARENPPLAQVDFDGQRQAYIDLVKLCCHRQKQDKILPFLTSLQADQVAEEGYDTLHTIIDFLWEEDYPFLVCLDWKQEVEDLDLWLRQILAQDYGVLSPDFPPYSDDTFLGDIFPAFNQALQDQGLQMGFIDTQSDEYVFVVHRLEDQEKVSDLVHKIGYAYFSMDNEEMA